MKSLTIATAIAGTVLLGASGSLLAAGKLDIGKVEYEANCAVCHGMKGKGDGVIAPELKSPVPDLTILARKNNGVFPTARVYEVIDGRQEIKAHGWRDMPVWGGEYLAKGANTLDDYPYDREAFVRGRILALIDYLYRLQAK
ncbi:MAG TPA: c-type cytochrome [Burkholderiales bacterium]